MQAVRNGIPDKRAHLLGKDVEDKDIFNMQIGLEIELKEG